eukprot:scaffold433_cov257-Pinguiococcus_pyrenoidosus.AAC.10
MLDQDPLHKGPRKHTDALAAHGALGGRCLWKGERQGKAEGAAAATLFAMIRIQWEKARENPPRSRRS